MSEKVETIWTLFDDESVRKKCTVMSKWDAMLDDSRNPDNFGEDVEKFLEFGHKYKISIEKI